MTRSKPPNSLDQFVEIRDEDVAAVARRIAEYWLGKPGACDTAKGVREWWLDTPVADHMVRKALEELETMGVAAADAVGEGQAARYRLVMPVAELQLRLADGPGALGVDGRPLRH